MKKNFYLIVGLIGMAYVINSFFTDKTTDEILFIELNIWFYRLIWGVMSVLLLANYYALRKADKKADK